ncbi:MAG TPA: MlaD family protein [Longimicrobiales bacterium]|nr:MlaD family protein [Longimicrobiales bacterium]
MTDQPSSGNHKPRPSDDELSKALPKNTGGREARVGIFVIFGMIALVAVLFLLTDPATMRGRYMLVTTVEDAGGVRRGDPVQMRGVIIGRINGFEMMPNGRVAVRLELEGEWKIPEGSRTELGSAGMFGGRTMEILPSDQTTYHQPFDTLPGSDGGLGLLGNAEALSAKADSVLSSLQSMMDAGTVASVQGSATELQTLLTDLSAMTREQRGTLKRLTESLANSAEGLEDAAAAGPDVARAIARADSAMAVLAETGRSLDQAASSLQTLLGRIERGEGTLGKLSTDDSLYTNMNRAAQSIAALVEDLKANPKKYINISIF